MKKRKKLFFMLLIIYSLFSLYFEFDSYKIRDFDKIDFSKALIEGLSVIEYNQISEQTGLTIDGIKDILKKKDCLKNLELFQKQNITEYFLKCSYLKFPTKSEKLIDEKGNEVKLIFPDLKNGDILYTNSTHTLFYRHGHVGLVVGDSGDKVLEAKMPGKKSKVYDVTEWKSYSTIVVLRPDNLDDNKLKCISEYALENLCDIKYSFVSTIKHSLSQNKDTQCAHLVWLAYKSIGINLDSNGGLLILPKDILRSPFLKTIWSYGTNAIK